MESNCPIVYLLTRCLARAVPGQLRSALLAFSAAGTFGASLFGLSLVGTAKVDGQPQQGLRRNSHRRNPASCQQSSRRGQGKAREKKQSDLPLRAMNQATLTEGCLHRIHPPGCGSHGGASYPSSHAPTCPDLDSFLELAPNQLLAVVVARRGRVSGVLSRHVHRCQCGSGWLQGRKR